jgi:hypothetical protein
MHPDDPSIKSFTDWMDSLRDDEGFWRSAAGSPVPMGGGRGWSSAINVRHTAKGLDLLLLQDRFCTQDAEVLHYILDNQGEDGSFPQVVGGDSDIWATAYAMNLLIRALSDSRAKATAPRRKDPQQWSSELTTSSLVLAIGSVRKLRITDFGNSRALGRSGQLGRLSPRSVVI